MTVTPVSDPCVGNLATPVNSGYFIKGLINNLPLYRPGISPNFRGLETGAAFGYLLYGPFTICGPLRATEYQADRRSAGRHRRGSHPQPAVPALQPARQAAQHPPPPTPPSRIRLLICSPRTGWADFTSGFWLGGCGGAVFAWFLCNTVHVQDLFKIAAGVWSVG